MLGLGWADEDETGRKIAKKRGRKLCFRARQVGAFCKFRQGDTGGPFIFCPKMRFFRFFVRLRG